jgi:hypothetical protein
MANLTFKPQLPEHLDAAYSWISAAGEWYEAKADPEQYAQDASANAERCGETGVTQSDLVAAIEWATKNESALYDENNNKVSAIQLGVTDREYKMAIKESFASGTHEGWIEFAGTRLYAR